MHIYKYDSQVEERYDNSGEGEYPEWFPKKNIDKEKCYRATAE